MFNRNSLSYAAEEVENVERYVMCMIGKNNVCVTESP